MHEELVHIQMVTYNHEPYIREAIESVLMQKTNFNFRLIIGEDCSTDQTSSIVREYAEKFPEKITAFINKKNLGIFINAQQIRNVTVAKYVAILEGDDYWTDPNKLQTQVDFLEANPEYSICWGGYSELWMSNNTFIKPSWMNQVPGNLEINLDNLFNPYCTLSLTAMFRSHSFDITKLKDPKYIKDNTIYIQCLTKGKGYLMGSDFGVYRIHNGGVYSALSDFEKSSSSYLNIREALLKIKGSRSQNLIQIKKELMRMTLTSIPKKFFLKHSKFLIFGIFELGIFQFMKIIKKRFIHFTQV